jgi:hypothetical protein
MLSAISNSVSPDWYALTARQGRGAGEMPVDAAEAAYPGDPGEERPEVSISSQGKDALLADEAAGPGEEALSEPELREVEELKKADREVRQHEQQHLAAGGSLVRGGASYSYRQGPDGKRYAVSGEVSIDTSEGRTPEETLSRARRIRAAALAPANPSPQDRSVAAAASQMEMRALQEIARNGNDGNGNGNGNGQTENGSGEMAARAYRQAGVFGSGARAGASRFSAFA